MINNIWHLWSRQGNGYEQQLGQCKKKDNKKTNAARRHSPPADFGLSGLSFAGLPGIQMRRPSNETTLSGSGRSRTSTRRASTTIYGKAKKAHHRQRGNNHDTSKFHGSELSELQGRQRIHHDNDNRCVLVLNLTALIAWWQTRWWADERTTVAPIRNGAWKVQHFVNHDAKRPPVTIGNRRCMRQTRPCLKPGNLDERCKYSTAQPPTEFHLRVSATVVCFCVALSC